VVTSSSDPLVEDADSVILTCTADANPPPTYLWVRKNGPDGEVGRGPVLTISPVDRTHIDTYSCIASNSLGSSRPRAVAVDVHCKEPRSAAGVCAVCPSCAECSTPLPQSCPT
jgi:hypothetical protein